MLPALLAVIRSVPRSLRRATAGPRPDLGGAMEILSAGEFERCIERERCRADRGKRCFSVVVLSQREDMDPTLLDGVAFARFAQELRKRVRSTDIVGQVGTASFEVLLTDTESKGALVVLAWAKQTEFRLGFELQHSIHVYPAPTELDRSPGLRAALQTGRAEPEHVGSEDAQPLEVSTHASSII